MFEGKKGTFVSEFAYSAYAAPEVGKNLCDGKVDVWAFGKTIEFLLTGQVPRGNGKKNTRRKRAEQEQPDLSPEAQALLDDCGRHQPEDAQEGHGKKMDVEAQESVELVHAESVERVHEESAEYNTEAVRKEDIEAVREENIKVHRKDAAEGARQDEIEGIIQVNVATEFARTKETTMMNAPTMGFYEMAASKEFDPKIAVIQAVPSNSTVPMVLAPKAPVPERIVEQDGRQDIVLEHEKLAPQHTTEDRARNDDAHDDGTREEPACGSVVVMDAFAKDKLDSNVNAPQE
ncbi:hypothetical protein BGW39_011246 [Mortierella sp. 14UC]|nr:hypothetical protein BGW39_011246 [Mortierella sp. 14UC]